ncbi:MAG: CAP domain-containing protein [Elainellaceae cyanobacterium]
MYRPWRNIWTSILTSGCRRRSDRVRLGLTGLGLCLGLTVHGLEAEAISQNGVVSQNGAVSQNGRVRSPQPSQCVDTISPLGRGTAVPCPRQILLPDRPFNPSHLHAQIKGRDVEPEPLVLPLHESLVESILSPGEERRDRPSHETTIRNIEQQVFELVNQYRIDQGLSPLQLDDRISVYARQHSEAIATRQISFGHGGFSDRVDRIGREIRYRRIGENVAFNQGMMNPAQRALRGWLNSSTHRDNIGGRYQLTGIGVARDRAGGFYITQIFLRRR